MIYYWNELSSKERDEIIAEKILCLDLLQSKNRLLKHDDYNASNYAVYLMKYNWGNWHFTCNIEHAMSIVNHFVEKKVEFHFKKEEEYFLCYFKNIRRKQKEIPSKSKELAESICLAALFYEGFQVKV